MNRPSSNHQPCVMIIDDDPSVRDALLFLMKSIQLDALAYASANEFLESLNPDVAGCIVSDIRMPGMSGLTLQDELLARGNNLPLILITGHGDIAMAVKAIKKGAFDFLTKPFRDQDLLDTIDKAIAEHQSTMIAMDQQAQLDKRLASLTKRERQVFDLVVAGKANKTIAQELSLSTRTVEVHRRHMMEKMDVRTMAELLALFAGQQS